MTASNGSIYSEERKNYFNSVQTYFPEPDNGKIDTFIFLEAAKGVVSLIGKHCPSCRLHNNKIMFKYCINFNDRIKLRPNLIRES